MSKPILVTYASRFGSTAEVASRIGGVLRREGAEADVRPIADVQTLEPYRALIVGSAIRRGKWLPEAVRFIGRFHAELINTPVAYFTVCMTLRDDTPENRLTVNAYHDSLFFDYPDIEPVSLGMFAGALVDEKLRWYLRLYTRSKRLPRGDYRDWQKVDAWTREIFPLLAAKLL